MLLLPTQAIAQQNDLYIKANELAISNPDEAIKIAEHLINLTNTESENAKINLLLAKLYLVKGDYNKTITYLFNKNNTTKNTSTKTKIDILLLKSNVLRQLYLDKLSQNYLLKVETHLLNTPLEKEHAAHIKSRLSLEKIYALISKRDYKEALKKINTLETNYIQTNNIDNAFISRLFLAKEKILINLNQHDSAWTYIEKSLESSSQPKNNNLSYKAEIYRDIGKLYMEQKAFKKSEEALFIATKFAEIIDNPILLKEIHSDLVLNYIASNQKNKHKVYSDELLVLNNQVEAIEQKSINTLYGLLTEQENLNLKLEEQKYNRLLYLLIAGVIFIVFIGIFLLFKAKEKKKRLNEIIKYLQISKANFSEIKPLQKKTSKRIAIPEETEKMLLNKLKRFEKSQKYLNKDISLAVLSGAFETNTKYLSAVINKHYNDNFNTFINKLRINYIINKLKNDPHYINYKISFLAEECGYSSHSSFATVFKSVIGMSPVKFINLIKEEHLKSKKNNT